MNQPNKESIDQYDLWYCPDVKIICASRFLGSPGFYPVYRYKDIYSWSILELIKHIGCVDLDAAALKLTQHKDFMYLPANLTPVKGLYRLGGPVSIGAIKHRTPESFANAMAKAMGKDIEAVESRLPGFTNIILTGGKDSLNLLLLPWKNPVIVASAAPNAALVKKFIKRNELPHEFVELINNDDDSLLKQEILSNCGRIDIRHIRWQRQCRELGKILNGKAVFWGGSLGDTFMTPKWPKYRGIQPVSKGLRKLNRWTQRLEYRIYRVFPMKAQQQYLDMAWYRGAMWQAVSKAIHREVTGCLSLSGYHGDAVLRTLSETALWDCVKEDVRPLVGAAIVGRRVEYPAENPAPPPTNRPFGISSLRYWADAMQEEGIALC